MANSFIVIGGKTEEMIIAFKQVKEELGIMIQNTSIHTKTLQCMIVIDNRVSV